MKLVPCHLLLAARLVISVYIPEADYQQEESKYPELQLSSLSQQSRHQLSPFSHQSPQDDFQLQQRHINPRISELQNLLDEKTIQYNEDDVTPNQYSYGSSFPSQYNVKRGGGGRWKMRMFKRDPDVDYENNPEKDETININENSINESKRGGNWKMRMFKKGSPWKMRMFKRPNDKKSPWQMRMFKRFTNRIYGKRPDKWQMRMFKRDPELSAEDTER